MKAKICDCCGCTYSKNNRHETRGRIHGSYINGIAYVSEGSVDAISDLCDDCIDDLFYYISSHKKNEVLK